MTKKSLMWSNGSIVETTNNVSSLNFVMHYGSPAAWEGIRAYAQSERQNKLLGREATSIFKLKDHIDRLFHSAKIVNLESPFTKTEVEEACIALVQANGAGDLYLRPILYSNQDAESVRATDEKPSLDIYAFPVKDLHARKNKGISVSISSYSRGYPQFQMQAKTPGNYVLSQAVKSEMAASGMDDVLFLDNLGYVTEATVGNIFIVKGKVITTPPDNGSILPGITRDVIMRIHRCEGVSNGSIEKPLTRADVYTADEMFMTGTYAEVVPIVRVDGRLIGNGEPGPVTKGLAAQYEERVRNTYVK